MIDTIITYGPGGFDPEHPDDNVIAVDTVPVLPTEANRRTIAEQAGAALAANRAYIASTPNAAQVAAQTKALSRQMNGIIRLLLERLDGTD